MSLDEDSDIEIIGIFDSSDKQDDACEDMEVVGGEEGDKIHSTEISDENQQWKYLPSIPLQMVYSYVKRRDQTNMSLVCKNWMSEFGAPCNWRKICFYFPEKAYSDETIPVLKFAKRYGHMIRHLDVIARRVSSALLRTCAEQFEQFVHAIHHRAKLHTITFYNLKSYFRWLDDDMRSQIIAGICQIFKSQKNIQYVDFHTCDLRRTEAISIFNAMFYEGKPSIKKIQMKRMICERQFDDEDEEMEEDDDNRFNRYQWIFGILNNVVEWETDYNEFVENVIIEFSNMTLEQREQLVISSSSEKSLLRKLRIQWDGWNFNNFNGIPYDCWKIFTKHFPELVVDYIIGPTNDPGRALELFLLKRLPIRSLIFRATVRYTTDESLTTAQFFQHLLNCQYNETLQELNIVWTSGSETFAIELDDFIRKSPNLKTVEIQVPYPLLYFDVFFDSWIREPPNGIEAVSICISNVPDEDTYGEIYSMADNFLPILQLLGINFILILEYPDYR